MPYLDHLYAAFEPRAERVRSAGASADVRAVLDCTMKLFIFTEAQAAFFVEIGSAATAARSRGEGALPIEVVEEANKRIRERLATIPGFPEDPTRPLPPGTYRERRYDRDDG